MNWLPCVAACASLRWMRSKLPRPNRPSRSVNQSGRALKRLRRISPGLSSPESMRAYSWLASRASEIATSTVGSTTITSAASMVDRAARLRRCFMRGSSQRFRGANSRAMIAPQRMVP
ncbi:hypothetical protein D9M68_996090 [compost metagenome]